MSKQKRILTWHANWRRPGGRWRKYVDGRALYFGHGKSPADTKSYRAAERRYFEFMQERERTTPVEVPLAEATLADICEKFLQQLLERHDRSEVCPSYFDKARCCLEDFVGCVGGSKKFATTSELDLADYRSATLSLPISNNTGKPIKLSTARDRLAIVKTFYRWAYQMRLCELPRNLMTYTRIPSNGQPRISTFSMDELNTLWANAAGRQRCWMALALNGGMGAKDLSDLRIADVDWGAGYVERERPKTGVKSKHKLWSVTMELLAEHRPPEAEEDARVFLSKMGCPLVWRRLVEGRLKGKDTVNMSFRRLMERLKLDGGRSFYSFRKTGASLIETIDPAATELYLSHSEKGMKRHYAQRDWGRLEGALVQMEHMMADVLTA